MSVAAIRPPHTTGRRRGQIAQRGGASHRICRVHRRGTQTVGGDAVPLWGSISRSSVERSPPSPLNPLQSYSLRRHRCLLDAPPLPCRPQLWRRDATAAWERTSTGVAGSRLWVRLWVARRSASENLLKLAIWRGAMVELRGLPQLNMIKHLDR